MSLDPRIDELFNKVNSLESDVDTLKTLLQKLVGGGKIDLNLTVRELAVNIQHAGNRVEDLDTQKGDGKILYCALTDLHKQPFSEADMSAVLDERGWHMAHGTLAPILSNVVKQNLLIKIPKTRPFRYRLPSKVTFRGENL